MSRTIPRVRAWRVTLENGERWLVWAPTKLLAKLNFQDGAGFIRGTCIKTIGRCTSADSRSTPLSLVERI